MAKYYSTISHTKIKKYLQDNSDRLVNVNDIDVFLKSEGIEVNSSTIYRYLNKLSDGGELLKYAPKDGAMSSFQYVGEKAKACLDHLHLHCTSCGKIIHLECGFMSEIKDHIMAHHGFVLQCESSVLYGVCEECKNANC